MKQKLPAGVVIAAVVVVAVGVLYFGWRAISGGPNADVTAENIQRYQAMKTQAQAHKMSSPEEAAKAGAPMSRNSPMGGAQAGAPTGGGTR